MRTTADDHIRAEGAARLHSESGILSLVGQFAIMQGVLAVAAVVRNKVVAYRLGPAGFGEIAQLALVAATLGTLVSFGMGVGISRNAAGSATGQERRALLATANGIVLSLAAVVCGVCAALLVTGRLLPLTGLSQTTGVLIAFGIFIAGVPLEALKGNYLALLQGILDVKALAIRRAIAVLLGTAIAVPLVWVFGFIGAALQSLVVSAFIATLLGVRCRELGHAPLSVRFHPAMIAQLASFGVVSLASGFAQSFTDTAIRTSLIHASGAAANGLLQAPWELAQTVKGIVLTSIGSISLVTIAGQKDVGAISRSVDKLLNVVVPVATSALGLLGLLGSHALAFLYSSSFVPGSKLFPFILAADMLMVFAWVAGAPILAFGDRVLWLSLELVYAAVRWIVAIVLFHRLGAAAVVVGYLAAVSLHALLNFAVFRARYNLHVAKAHLVRVVFGAGFVAALSVIGSTTQSPFLFGAGAVAWLAFTAAFVRRAQLTSVLPRVFT